MSYDDDHTLDKTMAWFFTCLAIVLLTLIGWGMQRSYQDYTIDREAMKSGYCEVVSTAGAQYGYHWEKCAPPAAQSK